MTVLDLFAAQVARTPEATAVVCGAQRLSFAELDRRSARLAQRLTRRGVGPETLVGLCADRGVHMAVGVLAVRFSGFIHGVMGERLYAALLLSLMGLRPAEVCGLRWEDVGLENATIDSANMRTMMGNRYVVEKDTKSLAGERALPLPGPVLDALKAFRALQEEERIALGEAYVVSGYVLVHETGVAFTIKQLRRRAYRLMQLLGLRRVRLYLARAACFTYLANRGVPCAMGRA